MSRAPLKKQKPMKYGFTAFNGKRWSDANVDHYNMLTERIAQYDPELHKPGSLSYEEQETRLNNRHRFFCIASGIA